MYVLCCLRHFRVHDGTLGNNWITPLRTEILISHNITLFSSILYLFAYETKHNTILKDTEVLWYQIYTYVVCTFTWQIYMDMHICRYVVYAYIWCYVYLLFASLTNFLFWEKTSFASFQLVFSLCNVPRISSSTHRMNEFDMLSWCSYTMKSSLIQWIKIWA